MSTPNSLGNGGFYNHSSMYDSKELCYSDVLITTDMHADEIFSSKHFYYALRRESDIVAY